MIDLGLELFLPPDTVRFYCGCTGTMIDGACFPCVDPICRKHSFTLQHRPRPATRKSYVVCTQCGAENYFARDTPWDRPIILECAFCAAPLKVCDGELVA